jgi:hypothetical protein
MSYQRNIIRLYVCLIINSIKKKFTLTNIYIYIRVTTKKLSKLYLQKILVLYKIKEIIIESNSII